MTYYMLAAEAFDWENVITVLNVLPRVFLLIGAIIGFATGVRKMPKALLAGVLASNIYSLILEMLQGSFGEDQAFVPLIVATISCGIVAIIFFAADRILAPEDDKEVMQSDIHRILEKEEKFRRQEEEEIEDLLRDRDADEDDLDRLQRQQRKRRKRYLDKMNGKLSLFSRLCGAVIVGLNALFAWSILIDVIMYIISATPLSTGALAPLYELESYQHLFETAEKSALDHIIICIFIIVVRKGYKNGVVNAIYTLFCSLASIFAWGLGFYIPFSPLGAEGGMFGFTAEIVNSVVQAIQPAISGSLPIAIPETAYQTIGQIATGFIYTIVLMIAMSIIKLILRKLTDASYTSEAFQVVDGFFGMLFSIVTCAIVIAAILFLFLLMERMGWLAATELFEGTQIFDAFYTEFAKLAGGWADKIVEFLPFGK